VDLEAVLQENQHLHGEVERLRELLDRHGIDPDAGTTETA
jgi:regulator of replication initiation timing